MKLRFSLVLTGLALFLGGAGSAWAASPCDGLPIDGTYKNASVDPSYHSNPIVIIHRKGCDITAKDMEQNVVWHFDLSGKTETGLPAKIVESNSHDEVARGAALTARFRMTLNPADDTVRVQVRWNYPKGPDNKFDVDVAAEGTLFLSGQFGQSENFGPMHYTFPRGVTGINLTNSKVRIVGIHHSFYVGPFAGAFLTGANYVLEKISMDGILGSIVNLVRVQ